MRPLAALLLRLALLALHCHAAAAVAPGALSGNYVARGEQISLLVSGTDPQPGALRAVTARIEGGSGACWDTAVGTITEDGLTLWLNATGARCVPTGHRIAYGTTTSHKGDLGTTYSISWRCFKPPTNASCSWPTWTPPQAPPSPPGPPPAPSPPGPPGSWPIACTSDSSGLESCWPTCQVRCPATARCCKTPYAADIEGLGCCDTSSANPDREPGCKAGPPQPLATDRPNVVIIGDSVSMGYTPWVAKHLGVTEALVQHAPWGSGSAICNTTTDPPCDPDPTGRYTGAKRLFCCTLFFK